VAASKESLEALHTAIANKLTESINAMEPGEKGLAALLNVARQFVKDNGIEAVPTSGSPLGNLSSKLQQFPFEPDEVH
jgi:hypothetical protein